MLTKGEVLRQMDSTKHSTDSTSATDKCEAGDDNG